MLLASVGWLEPEIILSSLEVAEVIGSEENEDQFGDESGMWNGANGTRDGVGAQPQSRPCNSRYSGGWLGSKVCGKSARLP